MMCNTADLKKRRATAGRGDIRAEASMRRATRVNGRSGSINPRRGLHSSREKITFQFRRFRKIFLADSFNQNPQIIAKLFLQEHRNPVPTPNIQLITRSWGSIGPYIFDNISTTYYSSSTTIQGFSIEPHHLVSTGIECETQAKNDQSRVGLTYGAIKNRVQN